MIQTKLKEDPQIKCNLTHKYSKGSFDKIIKGNQWIRISDCWFDNQKKGSVKPIHWPIRQK